MDADIRARFVTGGLAIAGVVVGVGAGVLVALGVSPQARFNPPPVIDNPGDPPVIIHGGSFHLYLQLKAIPKAPPPVPIDKNDISAVKILGYAPWNGTTNPVPTKLTPPWEVDVCDADPGAKKMCQAPGLKILGTAGAGMTVDILGDGKGTTYYSPDVNPPPFNYYVYHVLAGDKTEIHPAYLTITNGIPVIDEYKCEPGGDWSTCQVKLGSY